MYPENQTAYSYDASISFSNQKREKTVIFQVWYSQTEEVSLFPLEDASKFVFWETDSVSLGWVRKIFESLRNMLYAFADFLRVICIQKIKRRCHTMRQSVSVTQNVRRQ